jgi:transposase
VLGWEQAESMSDTEVEGRLFAQVGRNEPDARAPIDLGHMHLELRRPGVTLELLWAEYQQAVADSGTDQKPYQYSRFRQVTPRAPQATRSEAPQSTRSCSLPVRRAACVASEHIELSGARAHNLRALLATMCDLGVGYLRISRGARGPRGSGSRDRLR